MVSNQSSAPLLLDVREAARMLACCPNTIVNMTKAGHLRPVRIGKLVRYARTDLEDFVRRRGTDTSEASCAHERG